MRQGAGGRNIAGAQLYGLMRKILARIGACYLVVDGIDEASEKISEPAGFLDQLTELSVSSSPLVRFLVVSHNEHYIRSALLPHGGAASNPSIEYKITEKDTAEDINSFVKSVVSGVRGAMSLGKDARDHQDLLVKIMESILSRCGGMFLWVRFIQEDLNECRTINEVEETGELTGRAQCSIRKKLVPS